MTQSAFRYLDVPVPAADALAALPVELAGWFAQRFGQPTAVQRLAWPALGQAEHLLA